MFFDASNHRKYQKVNQTGVQRGTQNPSKILENPLWDLPGSLCVHRWPIWLQNCAKMVPKDLQMDPKWSPGDPKRNYKSTHSSNQVDSKQIYTLRFYPLISIVEISNSCQSLHSANQQATGCQRGRRQGRSLKIYMTLDMMLIYIFHFGCPGNICTKDEKRPTSSVVLRSYIQMFPGHPKYKI